MCGSQQNLILVICNITFLCVLITLYLFFEFTAAIFFPQFVALMLYPLLSLSLSHTGGGGRGEIGKILQLKDYSKPPKPTREGGRGEIGMG